MAKKRAEPRRMSTPTPFEQARDELFSHILRCGVLEASAEHQKAWFDDTMQYLADRYDGLDEPQLTELRVLGERYCRPAPGRRATPSSGPQKERCAITSIAPTPASVAVSAWARAGVAARAARALRTAAPASALAKRDVVADADVGGERGDHRAILLEREI